jgi:protein arginine kinase activator
MKCDHCGEDAVVHFTQITGGEMNVMHLCESCAAEKGLETTPPAPSFQLANLLAQMGPAQESDLSAAEGSCAFCGLELSDFREAGRFGCPECYTSFEGGVRSLLRRIHGSTQHVGKVYLTADPSVGDRLQRLTALTKKLDRAVTTENFERAAELRDEIQALDAIS